MIKYVEILRTCDIACGYLICYEDFSPGCSFCGFEDHVIDNCPIIYLPKREIKVKMLKHPKKQWLAGFLGNATRLSSLPL